VVIAKIDGMVHSGSVSKYQVDGFPRFKLFRDGVPCTYDGSGSVEDFEEFIEKKRTAPSKLLNTEAEVNDFVNAEGKAKVVAVVEPGDSKTMKTWKKVVFGDGFEWIRFAHVTDPTFLGDAQFGTIKVYPAVGDDQPIVYNDLFVKSKVHQFLTDNAYPDLQPLNDESWHEISAKGKPHTCVFFWQGQEDFPLVKNIAKPFKGKVIFTYKSLNESTLYWADQWGASGTKFPTAIMITWPEVNEPIFWVYDEDNTTFTQETGESFVSSVLEGKYTSYRKSDPIPEKNDYPVTIVVGKTFEEIAYDENKDVFITFHAPWCEFSSELEPTWQIIGELFENNPNLVIGKFDLSSNRPPDAIHNIIEQTPTLLFFPAGSNKKPEGIMFDMEEDRTVRKLVDFILQHATNIPDVDLENLPVDPIIEEAEPEPEEKFEL